MKALYVLVATEDGDRLTDDEYERRMDWVLRRARTVVSLDRLAREREAALLAASPDVPVEE